MPMTWKHLIWCNLARVINTKSLNFHKFSVKLFNLFYLSKVQKPKGDSSFRTKTELINKCTACLVHVCVIARSYTCKIVIRKKILACSVASVRKTVKSHLKLCYKTNSKWLSVYYLNNRVLLSRALLCYRLPEEIWCSQQILAQERSSRAYMKFEHQKFEHNATWT